MKRLFLHIGQFKTGTTTAQRAMSENRGTLLSFGYDYPDYSAIAYCHAPAITHFENADYREFWTGEARRLRHSKADNIILSGEIMSYFSREQFSRVREAFDGFYIVLVLSLRHWSTFWPSLWRECIMQRDSITYPETMVRLERNVNATACSDFSLPLKRAAGLFDEMSVIPYNKSTALADFGEALEFPAQLAKIMQISPRTDISPPWFELEARRICNLIITARNNWPIDVHLRWVTEQYIAINENEFSRLLVCQDLRDAFLAPYMADPTAMLDWLLYAKLEMDQPQRRSFDRYAGVLDRCVEDFGLAAMPTNWGKDEIGKIAFTELVLADVPRDFVEEFHCMLDVCDDG